MVQVVVALLQLHLDPAKYRGTAGDPLIAGLFAGVSIAAFASWRRSRALENIWQRGVIGVLAAVGALLVGFFAGAAHSLFGMIGVLAWTVLAVVFGIAGGAWAVKGSGTA